ncbi:hypothetical protein [Pseudoxanthomonas gei]|uniref:hypothetical protein n=1 Tax=Pseudoxanthomonas gei TaxID=1383030 RepID=UPI001391DB1D|nr:hypothetical protein [Pseudoxanthomonas gei]
MQKTRTGVQHKRPRRAALTVALAALPGMALAAPINYDLGLAALRSDNIGLSETDPQSETVVMPQLRFGIEQAGARLKLNATGQVQYLDYVDDTFDDGFRGALSSQALWTMIPDRLEWTIEDYLSLQPVDSLTSFNPGNQQQTNVFVTGPTLYVRSADATHGQVDARYTRSYAEESQTFNSDRYGIAMRLLHDLSPTRTVSANLEVVDVNYQEVAPEANFTRYDLYGRYVGQLRDLEMRFDVGYSKLKYGGVRKDESLPLARASFNWQLTPRSALNLDMNYDFSDAAENMILPVTNVDIGGPNGNPAPPIVAGVYKETGLRLGYEFTGERLSMEFRPYYVRLNYVELSAEDEKDWGGYASVSYRLRPRLVVQAAASLEDRKFEAPVRRYREKTAGIALENRFTAHWFGRLELQRRERNSAIIGQDYKENVAIVSFNYRR